MRGQFLFHFLCSSFLFGDVQFHELDVVRHRCTFIAFFAMIVEAESGLYCGIYQVIRPKRILFEEEVPLINVLEVVVR